ncbi:MAG: methionine--tRNA ligase [Caldicoprobacter oshimai]|uniref:Methionine--tRNA ligase n=1 Tax=Caldicoprobacter faecalis TaxID=937334 RepID=A0A1I5VZM5_9FIRM|nr:methionine--tRNA ligase [Caldicoprobacter faecalis]PZN11501.1 MAG: methionine--tRNA ligase [Caldicoprobacter oshimai]SFQ12921.1 methionyl-tRNA synthetase [Caldicoprobacter faecalis]
MADKKTFYITTPIYYPSDKLHIGHAYTTVAADAMARFKRLTGYDVMFLTGTDEHGQKIERLAREKGVTPKEYVDNIVAGIKELWKLMDISYDDFIRTSEERHEKVVQKIFKKLYDQGDIYKGEYQGWYCTPCESFWTERQLVDGKCPDCGRNVELVKEEAYFFKLSKYQQQLIEYIEAHDEFIQPPSRKNEMLNNFLRPGLEDLCVSRTSFRWGIPVPFDDKHVIYVWIDALSNYLTALGYMTENDEKYRKYWPADVHLVGKEIVRFHTIIWPIMLMALGEPLPKQVFGHGWLVLEGGKMSKSKGNVVDPVILVERYGVDAVRYFLLREVPFGADGVFSNEALINRINSDLVNDLGNLVNRTIAMVEKYFDGLIPEPGELDDVDTELRQLALSTPSRVEELMNRFEYSNALAEIWKLIGRANKYIDETTPWILAKDPSKRGRLGTVLYNLSECLRMISVLISPFMTRTPEKIRQQLGVKDESLITWDSLAEFGKLPPGTRVQRGEVIFPRLDMEKELKELEEIQQKMKQASQSESANCPAGQEAVQTAGDAAHQGRQESSEEKEQADSQITIEDFAKLDLRVAKVISAERVEKSNKLLKLTLEVGKERRQVVSGIAKYYTPEQLVGRAVILVANLKPAKLMGIVSEGMILAATDDKGNLALLTVDQDIASGSKIS